ncbi:MAG: pilus assembly protein TadG-related protein [Acidimicrobiia bacterium]|nr:pilus assembly protein TadG-related protein [Acidimicrobiia bacterium]
MLILFVITLTVLLGFSALVVDLGMARSKKRQIQNTADSSALAAAQVLPVTATADADAKSYASTNLAGGSFPWNTCTDSGALPRTASSPCISYDNSYNRVRVRVPTQTYAALFGRILGRSTLSTGAVAEARVRNAGLSGTLPFSLFAGVGSGEVCIKSGSTGTTTAPCSGSVNGDFNMLDVSQYGNEVLHTDSPNPHPYCEGNADNKLMQNIAMGVDHDLTVYVGTEILDGCYNAGPNTLKNLTGNKSNPFDEGLLSGSGFPDGEAARLQRTSALAPVGLQSVRKVAGVSGVDNTGLWEFISPSLEGSGSVPSSCWPSVFGAIVSNGAYTADEKELLMHVALGTCVGNYAGGGYSAPVFARNTVTESPIDLYDIQLSPRFVYLPRFAESGPCGNNSYCLHITNFRAVFLQTLNGDCNATSCNITYEPGPWNPASIGKNNKKASEVTGWVLPAKMLPGDIGERPGIVGQNRYIELVK